MWKLKRKTFFTGEQSTIKPVKKGDGRIKEFIAKLSRGIMLPVAMLPIAGLFLGIGSTVSSQSTTDLGLTIGNILMLPGNIIFTILPLLFAIAIAITFTKDAGTAGLSALVGWTVMSVISGALVAKHGYGDNVQYYFLWYRFSQLQFDSIFSTILGISTLNTSVFGGVIVGAVVAYLYNRFKNIQLPTYIGFFSGVRFIPIITFITSLLIGLMFAIIWPMLGLGLYYFGVFLSTSGKYGGLNSFVYGIVNRMLMPFGLHHVLNIPLWFTSIGGTFDNGFQPMINSMPIYNGDGQLIAHWYQLAPNGSQSQIVGDLNIQIYLTQLIGKKVHLGSATGVSHVLTIQDVINSLDKTNNVLLAPGQYTNFAYVFNMFGYPGAAAGMLLAAPKGDARKQAISIVVPGTIVSTLTGTSEAIEFTFLFLAPWLFWGFCTVMAGIAGLITTTMIYYAPAIAPHVTFSFSQGMIDFVIYGVLPDARGGGTHCWVLLILTCGYFPIYMYVFRWAILKWNLPTPGRGENAKLYTKADWKERNENKAGDRVSAMIQKTQEIIKAYGGKENILNVDACITKLRVQVKDTKIVDEKRLKELGAMGIMHPSAQSVYAVFGQEADIIKNYMLDVIKE